MSLTEEEVTSLAHMMRYFGEYNNSESQNGICVDHVEVMLTKSSERIKLVWDNSAQVYELHLQS